MVDQAWREAGLFCDGRDRRARETLAREDLRECGYELRSTYVAETSAPHRLVVHPIYRRQHEHMATPLISIPWPDVVAVGIRTTADGPFVEDVFWQFLLRDRCIEVPGSWMDNAGFDELRGHLPGLDWAKVTRAMGSTVERVFRVWHREDSGYSPTDEELGERYRMLIERLGGNGDGARPAFDRVLVAWSDDRRRYHGVEHLIDCLRELDRASVTPSSADVVELALWYHDLVYHPASRDCEERSAQALLADASALAIPVELFHAAADLVRSTAHADGAPPPNRTEIDLMLDIDLSILGRDVLRFMDFDYGVEEEHSHVSRLRFRFARGRFLAALLARPQLFRTERFRARYEQHARAQIGGLLASPRYRYYRWLRWLLP